MAQRTNELGQPIGAALPDWAGAKRPVTDTLQGAYCTVERLDAGRHAADLFDAFAEDETGGMWTYLSDGPFGTRAELEAWLAAAAGRTDQIFYAVRDRGTGRAQGFASYLRIQPDHGVVEVGSIAYAPCLQRTPAATEAMVLMMTFAFEDCGYRRYEWKCDALNAASRRAAERLGFTYDGLFRQAVVYRGRNRDTAWYSIVDQDWPALRLAFAAWLAPDNFDAAGRQKRRLAACMAAP